MPSATSSAMAPVGITSIGARTSSPSRMIEPRPNFRSIWASAVSRDLSLSPPVRLTALSLPAMGTPVGFKSLLAASVAGPEATCRHRQFRALLLCCRLLSPCRGSRPRKGDPEWPSQATTLNEHLFDRGANTPHPRRKSASSRYGPGCGPEEVAAVIDVRVENDQLRVRLTGWDAFSFCWRPSWSYEVPVSKVVRVYVRPARPAVGARS